MNLIPVKTPRLVKKLFSNYVWDIKTKEKVLYLTFDDGPTPDITSWTLDVLKEYNAKASFFCIGTNIEKHPDIFRKIQKAGHTIGNHTFNHPRGWYTNTDDYVNEVLRTEKVMMSEFGVHSKNQDDTASQLTHNPKLFRPPYGQITTKQGKELLEHDYKIIMWDVLAFDWMNSITKEACAKNVISKATSGSIIVFHDSLKACANMQYALPKVLEYFSEKGFEFRRIPE